MVTINCIICSTIVMLYSIQIVLMMLVSIFISLSITFTETPILTLNSEFYCNSSSTVALVCSVMGELGMFGFAQWIHTFDGKYIRSLHGTTNRYISLLIINDCSFEDGGQYTCAVWNKDGDKLLWANQTTTLKFVCMSCFILYFLTHSIKKNGTLSND